MMKRDEVYLSDSCFNRARDDEYIFVLLERDDATPSTLRHWAAERVKRGKNQPDDEQILEALSLATEIERRQKLRT